MAEHMESSAQETSLKTSVKSKLQDRALLDKFTALSDAPEADRIKKTNELLKLLSTRQSLLKEDGICDELSYTVSRLVQGLSSHRKFARLGYSVALCQILRCFDALKVEHVLECMEKKASSQLTGQPSKAETTNVYLGKIFGYLTLVHSGRLFQESKQNIRNVIQQLLKLGQEKSSLQQLCINGLIQIIAQVKTKTFKKCILPAIKTRFTEGWGNCSPDTLLLLMYSSKYHQKKVEEFLTEHWLDPQLVSEKNFSLIADVVKRSASVYPLTHVVNEELVKSVVEQKLDIVSFWKTVVRPLFEPKGKLVSKNTLGLYYFDQLLPHLDTAEKIENILHPDITSVLCHTSQKQEDLGNKVTMILKKLVESLKSSKDSELQLAIMQSLVKKPGHFHFDRQTKTTTLSTMVTCLLPDASRVFVQELMKMFSRQPSWLYSKDDNRTECELWSVRELDVLVTMGDQSSSWQLDILQFLFLHSFFDVIKPSSDIPHCSHHTRELPDISRKCVVDNFFKAVSKCLSHSVQGQSRVTVLGNHLDVLFQLVEYGQTLLDNKGIVVLHQELSEGAEAEWTKMINTVKNINKKRQMDDKIRENHAFELLFLHVGLQLFTDAESAIESLQDLHVCYKKATQRRKSKAAEDGPEWIEVITELLLSMVFKGTALSRNVAKLVLTALADHMTPQAFQLIVKVLQQTIKDSEEDGPLGLEDDEDMEVDDEANEDENEDSNEEDDVEDSTDDDEEEEEESGTEEETNVTVDDELKKKVKSALGVAAVDSGDESDQDEEDEGDLSDSEMFKFDDRLAEAFICMRKQKNNKEEEKQLKEFKMRVLDMIAVIIKHHPTSAFVKDLVFPLLDLMEGGKRKKEQQLLGNKATDVFENLYRVKKIMPDSSVDREELLDMVSKLLQYSHKVSSDNMVKQVAKACLLMIRLLLNIEDSTGPSPLKTRSKAKASLAEKPAKITKDHDYYQGQVLHLIQTSLYKLLHKTEGYKSPLFIHTMIDRYPVMFWSLSDELVSTVADMKVKVYQRTQACGMLASMINKKVLTGIGPESWKDFLDLLQEKSSEILSSLTTDNYKAQFIKELLTIYGKVAAISAVDCRKVLGETGLQRLEQVKALFSTDIRGLYNKVVKTLGHGSNSIKEGKKKKKNRKRWQSSSDDHIGTELSEGSSPLKVAKFDTKLSETVGKTEQKSGIEKNKMSSSSPEKEKQNDTDHVAEDGNVINDSFIKEGKKKRKKKRRSESLDIHEQPLNFGLNLDESIKSSGQNGMVVPDKVEGVEKATTDDEDIKNVVSGNDTETETPLSKKKRKKRKSSQAGVNVFDTKNIIEAKEVSSPGGKENTYFENKNRNEMENKESEENSFSTKQKKHRKRNSDERIEKDTSEDGKTLDNTAESRESASTLEKTNETKSDNLEISSPSPKKKKHKHRDSLLVQSGNEKDEVLANSSGKSALGGNGTVVGSRPPEKMKHKHRRSSVAETKSRKESKFSPRYTRSMTKV